MFCVHPFWIWISFSFEQWWVVTASSPQSTCRLYTIFLKMDCCHHRGICVVKKELGIGTIKRFRKPVYHIKVQPPFTRFCHLGTKIKFELLTVPCFCICSHKSLNASPSGLRFVKNNKWQSSFVPNHALINRLMLSKRWIPGEWI